MVGEYLVYRSVTIVRSPVRVAEVVEDRSSFIRDGRMGEFSRFSGPWGHPAFVTNLAEMPLQEQSFDPLMDLVTTESSFGEVRGCRLARDDPSSVSGSTYSSMRSKITRSRGVIGSANSLSSASRSTPGIVLGGERTRFLRCFLSDPFPIRCCRGVPPLKERSIPSGVSERRSKTGLISSTTYSPRPPDLPRPTSSPRRLGAVVSSII